MNLRYKKENFLHNTYKYLIKPQQSMDLKKKKGTFLHNGGSEGTNNELTSLLWYNEEIAIGFAECGSIQGLLGGVPRRRTP